MTTMDENDYEEFKSTKHAQKGSISLVKTNICSKHNTTYVPIPTEETADQKNPKNEDDELKLNNEDFEFLKPNYNANWDRILVEKQEELEKYEYCKCSCNKCRFIFKIRLLIFMIVFWCCGMGLSLIVQLRNKSLAEVIAFYTHYFSLMILCSFITKIIMFLTMKLLRNCTKNKWSAFYIKNIYFRLYFAILSVLWIICMYAFEEGFGLDVKTDVLKVIWCVLVTAVICLTTYLIVQHIILHSYFEIFEQQASKYKLRTQVIEIMLNQTSSLFNIPIINFLVDFPSHEQLIYDAEHIVSFKFNIVTCTRTLDDEPKDLILNSDLYSICMRKGAQRGEATVIADKDLTAICERVATVIMNRLNDRKKEILLMKKYENKSWDSVNVSSSISNKALKAFYEKFHKKSRFRPNLLMRESSELDKINKDMFIIIFREYPSKFVLNKTLLTDLAEMAWRKLTNDGNYRYLHVKVIKKAVFEMVTAIIKLKQSIDSYIIMINTLQRMINVLTPVALLFVYLYIFSFDFKTTLSLYVSVMAIVGFFFHSYFSSVLAGITFIMVMNPFFVGDYIMYDNIVYRVDEISLLSCKFTQMRNRYQITFQNKQLSESAIPIINFTRSAKQKYKWEFYFKVTDINDEALYEFLDKIKLKVKERIDYHLKDENVGNSFCEKEELDDIEWWTIKAKAYELDRFGRKELQVQMKYNTYCSDVQTLVFSCICEVIKELKYDCDPLRIYQEKIQ